MGSCEASLTAAKREPGAGVSGGSCIAVFIIGDGLIHAAEVALAEG